MENLNQYTDTGVELAMTYVPKLALAVVTLIIGIFIVKIADAVGRMMERRGVDFTLRPFLTSLISTVLKIMLIISVAGMVGIQMTSFIAILGAAGLAVGLALSGTLQNFAGGVMILIFKPFKVGDFVEVQGFAGVIKEIQIFNTIMKTGDNKTVIIPNSPLSSGAMVNYSTEPQRRVDMKFGIGYGDDIDKAKSVIKKLIVVDLRILKGPASMIAVSELADSSVNFVVRAWGDAAEYWEVFFDMQEKVKKGFDKEKISIPFPQMDVHVDK